MKYRVLPVCIVILLLAGVLLVVWWRAPEPVDILKETLPGEAGQTVQARVAKGQEAPPQSPLQVSDAAGIEAQPQPATLTLHGLVIDRARRPVEGAAIFVDHNDEPAAATTDWRGLFEIGKLPADAKRLFVQHPDYMPEWESIGTAAINGELLEVVLKKGAMLTGAVTLRGQPLANHKVTTGEGGHFLSGLNQGLSTQTDARGVYEFANLEPGMSSAEAILPVHGNEATPRKLSVIVLLEDERTTVADFDFCEWDAALEGRVLFNGEPVQEGNISIAHRNRGGACESFHQEIDAGGFYRFDALPAGLLEVQVSFKRGDGIWRHRNATIEIPGGIVTARDFLFEGRGVITGRCLGLERYDHIEAAIVSPDISGMLAQGGFYEMGETTDLDRFDMTKLAFAEDGSFLVEDLEAGTYTLLVIADADLERVSYTFASVTVSDSQEAQVVLGPDFITEYAEKDED